MTNPTNQGDQPVDHTLSSSEREVQGQSVRSQRPSTWGAASTQLDDWIAINPDGTVTAYSGKVELGTGTPPRSHRSSPRS